ncbi:MAG: RNA polymerase sigma factor [Dehalococcoidia bacterium]|nr:RNA polymerase sigma factor [Dehalococcoidia bacterium]
MADLVERWQSGDEEAFEAFFHQYKNLVFKTALLMGSDGQEAEDVLQEVFINAWNSRRSFDPKKGKLTTWLYRITVNQSISKHRKKSTVSTSLDMIQGEGFNPVSSSEEDSPDNLENLRLMRAVDSMNDKHRPVLVLRYFNDLSYSEIAQTLNIPLGTVKSRLNEAMKNLRRKLGEVEKS